MKPPVIWIVDDDDSVLELMGAIIERLGYEGRTFSLAADALAAFEKGAADVVITDVRMPDMDGIEVTRTLLERDPLVKVMLLTGYPSVPDAVHAIKSGAFDYLTKPFRMEEIRVRLKRALEARELSGRLATNRWLTWVLIASMPLWFLLGVLFGYLMRSL
jgi:DNA-binding NtrC family response regulator